MMASEHPPTITVRHAIKPLLSCIAACVFAFPLIIIALSFSEFSSSIRWLSGAGAVLLLIVAVDSAIPPKFRLARGQLQYRNTFIWRGWDISNIDRIILSETTWMGLPSSHLGIRLNNGHQVHWPDTTILRRKGKRANRAWEEANALATLLEVPLSVHPPSENFVMYSTAETTPTPRH